MKKVLTAITLTALLIGAFATGVYASANGWLTFTGDEKVERSKTDVDEIMRILRQVNEDKLSAEEALAELEALNPPGLVKKIKALESENAELSRYIAHLESELIRANGKVDDISGKTADALEEAQNYTE